MAMIRVINPNSNQDVTDGLAEGLAAFQIPGRIEVTCETLEDGPFGIETQAHIDSVVAPLLRCMQEHPADAHVIACYSDPGLALCRAEIADPVFGIMECGLMTALARGERFGVIALSEASIARHLIAIRSMGIENRLAAERPIGASVAHSAEGSAFPALLGAGRLLTDQDNADTVVLGCAGMARHRAPLEEALGRPVIDPVQAAVAMACGALLS